MRKAKATTKKVRVLFNEVLYSKCDTKGITAQEIINEICKAERLNPDDYILVDMDGLLVDTTGTIKGTFTMLKNEKEQEVIDLTLYSDSDTDSGMCECSESDSANCICGSTESISDEMYQCSTGIHNLYL